MYKCSGDRYQNFLSEQVLHRCYYTKVIPRGCIYFVLENERVLLRYRNNRCLAHWERAFTHTSITSGENCGCKFTWQFVTCLEQIQYAWRIDKKWFFVVSPYTAPLLELNYFFLSFCRISFWIGWKQTNGQQLIRLICYIYWAIPGVANFSTERAKLYKNAGTCWTKLIIHVRIWVKLLWKVWR